MVKGEAVSTGAAPNLPSQWTITLPTAPTPDGFHPRPVEKATPDSATMTKSWDAYGLSRARWRAARDA
jgi:hypothetical protein